MTCEHTGHDQDCAEVECPTCYEVVRDPDAHTCKRMGWTTPLYLVPDLPDDHEPWRTDVTEWCCAKHRDMEDA